MILICERNNEKSPTRFWLAEAPKEVEREVEGKIVNEEWGRSRVKEGQDIMEFVFICCEYDENNA